jgi:hypothetical protein
MTNREKNANAVWDMVEGQVATTLIRFTKRYPTSKRIPILKKLLHHARLRSGEGMLPFGMKYLTLTKCVPPGFYYSVPGKPVIYFPGDRVASADRAEVQLALVHPQVYR